MHLARVIPFTGQIEAMNKFYAQVLALRQLTNKSGWKEPPTVAGSHSARGAVSGTQHRH
jgi:hypothetical protein